MNRSRNVRNKTSAYRMANDVKAIVVTGVVGIKR